MIRKTQVKSSGVSFWHTHEVIDALLFLLATLCIISNLATGNSSNQHMYTPNVYFIFWSALCPRCKKECIGLSNSNNMIIIWVCWCLNHEWMQADLCWQMLISLQHIKGLLPSAKILCCYHCLCLTSCNMCLHTGVNTNRVGCCFTCCTCKSLPLAADARTAFMAQHTCCQCTACCKQVDTAVSTWTSQGLR